MVYGCLVISHRISSLAAKQDFYLDSIDCFLDEMNLHFRALIIPDKSKPRHRKIYGRLVQSLTALPYGDMLGILSSW